MRCQGKKTHNHTVGHGFSGYYKTVVYTNTVVCALSVAYGGGGGGVLRSQLRADQWSSLKVMEEASSQDHM